MPAVRLVIAEVLALPPGFNKTLLASVVLVVVSTKVTVPVGVPALPVTFAVKVTPCPTEDGLSELDTAVVEGYFTLKLLLVPLSVPPLFVAVIVKLPELEIVTL